MSAVFAQKSSVTIVHTFDVIVQFSIHFKAMRIRLLGMSVFDVRFQFRLLRETVHATIDGALEFEHIMYRLDMPFKFIHVRKPNVTYVATEMPEWPIMIY